MGSSLDNTDACDGLGEAAAVRPIDDTANRASETHFWFEADSPLGTVFVTHFRGWVSGVRLAATPDRLEVDRSDAKWSLWDADTFVQLMPGEIKVHSVELDRGHDPALQERIREALIGGRTDVPIDLMSLKTAPKYREALQATTRIPRGETFTYGQIADLCGSRGQWVGTAVKRNPVRLLIPCHRVIHSQDSEDKWGYGSNLKKKLLAHERDSTRQLAE